MRILVVDDNPFVLSLIQYMLKDQNCTFRAAQDVEQAIAVFEREKEPFNLVITDIVMPKQDGTKLIEYVKKNHPDVPVLAITGGVENAARDYVAYASMFADEAMIKPFIRNDLIATVKRLTA